VHRGQHGQAALLPQAVDQLEHGLLAPDVERRGGLVE
jgi:hypothetical protein